MPGVTCPCEYLIDYINKMVAVETKSGRIYYGKLVAVNTRAIELRKERSTIIICCDKINAVTIQNACRD